MVLGSIEGLEEDVVVLDYLWEQVSGEPVNCVER